MHYLIPPKRIVVYKIEATSAQLNLIKIKETGGHEESDYIYLVPYN
jgi:hypothetical protein